MSAVKSAQKAILVNRISDGFLMWGILWVWYHLGSLEYDLLNAYSGSAFVGLAIFIGAMGKSVQILFHVWLPDSMEGPTPVSALIHAATLVTAGVYLLVRLHIHDETFVIIVGSLTAFMAAVFGATQSDLKRVIAFSTCSQLGLNKTVSIIYFYILSYFLLLSFLFLYCSILVILCIGWQSGYCLEYSLNNKYVYFGEVLQLQSLFILYTRGYSKNVTDNQMSNNKQKDILPANYVDCYTDLNNTTIRLIKKKYKNIAVIYLWYNKSTGKTYVGRTLNFTRRLENYLGIIILFVLKAVCPYVMLY